MPTIQLNKGARIRPGTSHPWLAAHTDIWHILKDGKPADVPDDVAGWLSECCSVVTAAPKEPTKRTAPKVEETDG